MLQQVRDDKWDAAKLDAAAIPAELRDICRRTMHVDPAQRFATADALADALSVFTADAATVNQKQSSQALKRSPAILIAVMVVPLLAFGAYYASRPTGSPSGNTNPSSSTLAVATVSPVPQSLIKRFDLIQIGNSSDRAEFSGSLMEYRPPRELDDVQVHAEFHSRRIAS